MISVEETVCAVCGKVAVLRTRQWLGDWRWEYRPIDGKTHSWECPDGCGAGLTKQTFVPASGEFQQQQEDR